MSGLYRGLAATLVAVTLLSPGAAYAHDRRVSAARVVVQDDAIRVTFRVRQIDLTSLSPTAATWAHGATGQAPPEVVEPIVGLYRVVGCALEPRSVVTRSVETAAEVAISWRLRCNTPPAALRIAPFPAVGHLHVVTVVHAPSRATDSASTHRVVVSDRERVVPLRDETSAEQGGLPPGLAYLAHGFGHAISGWDHIAFVVLLVLLSVRLRRAALLTTGFTVGHSVTLAVAALGWLEVDGRAVETLIATSIVGMAAENMTRATGSATSARGVALLAALLGIASGIYALLPMALMVVFASSVRTSRPVPTHEPHRRGEADEALPARFGLATCFGMIHGLGFSTGLDASGPGVVGRLFAFNIGVELAQLVVVGVAFFVLRALTRTVERRTIAYVGSLLLGAAGTGAAVWRAFS